MIFFSFAISYFLSEASFLSSIRSPVYEGSLSDAFLYIRLFFRNPRDLTTAVLMVWTLLLKMAKSMGPAQSHEMTMTFKRLGLKRFSFVNFVEILYQFSGRFQSLSISCTLSVLTICLQFRMLNMVPLQGHNIENRCFYVFYLFVLIVCVPKLSNDQSSNLYFFILPRSSLTCNHFLNFDYYRK